MGEAAIKAAGPPRGRRLGRAGRAGTVSAWRLLRSAEWVAYWLVAAPLAARLPARVAYRIACWRGDWCFRYRAGKRSEIVRNLRRVLGDELGLEEAERLARELFRMTACEIIDVVRLRGRGRSLGKLVEIRGREHLDAALAGGKGAILCSPHFGSCNSAFSLLHASGFPLTSIGRSPAQHRPDMSSAERRLWEFVYTRRLRRHRQRPLIEPLPGRVQVAAHAAVALRANEVVTISSDAPPLDADHDPRCRSDLPRTAGQAPARCRDLRPADRCPGPHGFHAPLGRLPPPGAGNLAAGADGRRDGDGVRALCGRDGCRHQDKPRPLGLLGQHG